MIRRFAVALLILVPALALAEVESGPKVGDKVAELKATCIVGLAENKEIDFAKERGDKTTVYIFVQRENFSRPFFKYLKTLDGAVKEIDEKIHIVTVFLGDNADAIKDYLPKLNMSGQFANTSLAVFTGEKSGPNNWGINTDAHVTVSIANKGKITANFPYTTINDTDVDKAKEALKKALDKK